MKFAGLEIKVADWMKPNEIGLVGPKPENFDGSPEAMREWAKRSALIVNIGTEARHSGRGKDAE